MASNRLSEDELEIRTQKRIAELEKANQELRAELLESRRAKNELIKLKDRLEVKLRDTNILHKLSTQYIEGGDSYSIFQKMVEVAIAITRADKGKIQILDPSTGKLKIVAQRGFALPFLNFFDSMDAGKASACGTAMERMERVVVEDVTRSPIYLGSDSLDVLLNEGIRAVQSTPLVSQSGQLLGIVSTHFSRVHSPDERELMLIDILARQAADIIERQQEERRIYRYNGVLEGINRIFGSVVKAETEEELGVACLSVAIELTGSKIGFVGKVGAEGLLHDIAISDMGWAQCKMYDRKGHRRPPGNFVLHGLYGHIVDSGKGFFTNDPSSHPDSIGLPEGHPPITSFLGVPLALDGKTVGMISVANREGGYRREQQEDLEAIAPAVMQALQRKKEEQERRQTEEALRESEERLQAIIDGSSSIIFVKDLEGRFILINKRLEELLGITLEELRGKTDYDIFPPEWAEYYLRHDRAVLESGVPEQMEEIAELVDGRHIFLANKFPLYDIQGNPYAVCAISTDITSRKKV